MTSPDPAARPIALIGYRGSGKSTVARILARLRGGYSFDTDELIARDAGKSIAEIFREEGERGFRRRETALIARLAPDPADVISVGGGAVLDPANVAILRGRATVVWLTAPPEVLWARIEADPDTDALRPDLTDTPGLAEVRRVLEQRTPAYDAAAHITVDTGRIGPEVAARRIIELLASPSQP